MLIFVQVCRTIDKNSSVFISSIGSGRTNESNGIYKKRAYVARESLKKIASEDIRSSSPEAVYQKLSSEAVYQKLTSSEAEDWKLQLVKCCYSECYDCRRNGSLKQRLIKRNLKAFDAYPLNSAGKGQ
jgi:hypothetical protein